MSKMTGFKVVDVDIENMLNSTFDTASHTHHTTKEPVTEEERVEKGCRVSSSWTFKEGDNLHPPTGNREDALLSWKMSRNPNKTLFCLIGGYSLRKERVQRG